MLTALRMVDEIDAGPVYAKRELDLHGSAEEIYVRSSRLAAEMIREIATTEPKPEAQEGEVVAFSRRRPEDSAIPELASPEAVYDFVRMLDADGYPPAFLDHRGFRYSFRRAVLYDGRVEADVTIAAIPDGGR